MSVQEWKASINTHLDIVLADLLPNHDFKKAIEYSLLPTGKLFRPLLVYSLASDLNSLKDSHKALAVSIEMHHTYTLIHDDLPSMDDDDYRRGRLSSHKKFNEWTAVLAGDSLLSLSYEALCEIPSEYLKQILKLFTKMTGPKGLILGQVMDLGLENNSLEKTLLIHELKTARLIQLSLMGSAVLADRFELAPVCEEIGLILGVNFQLLDDLCELTEEINEHEKTINPFIRYDKNKILGIIENNNKKLLHLLKKNSLHHLKDYIDSYMDKTKLTLVTNIESINAHIKINLDEVDRIFY